MKISLNPPNPPKFPQGNEETPEEIIGQKEEKVNNLDENKQKIDDKNIKPTKKEKKIENLNENLLNPPKFPQGNGENGENQRVEETPKIKEQGKSEKMKTQRKFRKKG